MNIREPNNLASTFSSSLEIQGRAHSMLEIPRDTRFEHLPVDSSYPMLIEFRPDTGSYDSWFPVTQVAWTSGL